MKLKVFGSSSAGNMYCLTDNEGNTLVLDAGVPLIELKKYLNFQMEGITGLLVTHSHSDHCSRVHEFIKAGIDVYTSQECVKSMGLESHRLNSIEDLKQFTIGPWTILPAPVEHDVKTHSFLIYHKPEDNKILYFTDTYYLKYRFAGLNNIIGEANHDSEILDAKTQGGGFNQTLRNRVISSHMSLRVFQEFLRANDLSKVVNIVMCHLSDSNSNERDFLSKIKNEFNKQVYIADKSLDIPFNKTPW